MTNIKTLVDRVAPKVTEYRRFFHRHPELGYHEEQTAAFVSEKLRELGVEHRTGVGKTGVVGLITGARPGPCIGLRADMDALPITEGTGLPFSSETPGVCHACGHDLHTAILLGCAEVLQALRGELGGSVKLIFQPAEECAPTGGVLGMIEDGVLEAPKLDGVIALHVSGEHEVGQAGVRPGAMTGSSDRFIITVKGKSCHSSAPQDGVDAIVAAAQLVMALQTVISRNVPPLETGVFTIGTIQGGDRHNIGPGEVKMTGTMRTLDPAIRQRMRSRIEEIISHTTAAMEATAEFEFIPGYPAVLNDPELTEKVFTALGRVFGEGAKLLPQPSMGGEDFAFFCPHVPVTYFRLGSRTPGVPYEQTAPAHSPAFSPDEDCLPYGVQALCAAVAEILRGES